MTRDARAEHPVDLTVHTLPAAASADGAARRTRAGRIRMILILLVCAAPVIASYFTYYVLRPQGQGTNYGTLIATQPPLPDARALALEDLDGRPADPGAFKGKWLLVVVAGGACDARCEHLLWLQRQVRESLGREKHRVERVWLVDDAEPLRRELLPAMQGARVLRAAPAQLAAWLAPASGAALADHLYVVDPLGRWMMRFPPRPDPQRLRRDIDRLLRASAPWQTQGPGLAPRLPADP